MRPFTDHEFDKLPTIFLTDNSKPWDPSVLHSTSSSKEYWLNSHPEPTNNNPNFLMTGDYLHHTVLLSDVIWTFNAWGDNPAKLGDREVIVFEHPAPDADEAIELEIEGDIPKLASLPDNDTSVSSNKSAKPVQHTVI